MFEVGRLYTFHRAYGDTEEQFTSEVIAVEMPLIKINRIGTPEIINTHSPNFIRAEVGKVVTEEDRARSAEVAKLYAVPARPA